MKGEKWNTVLQKYLSKAMVKVHNKNWERIAKNPETPENRPSVALLIIDNIRRKAYIKHIIKRRHLMKK